MLCFVVVTQSFIMNSHEVFIHIHQGCFAGTGAIVRLPQCQLSKPDGYGKISQCITTTKHSKAKPMCIFLGIYRKGHFFSVQTTHVVNSKTLILAGRLFQWVHVFYHIVRLRCTKRLDGTIQVSYMCIWYYYIMLTIWYVINLYDDHSIYV